MFHKRSYDHHEKWYNHKFPTEAAKVRFYEQKKNTEQTAASWLQQLFFNCIDPLLQRKARWLTVGDAYGFDASYIRSIGSEVMATDLNSDFLSVAQSRGLIDAFASANAESLNFADQSFDYILCKESYHHFPRPYAAVYEMIRVAAKGVVIIEPQDPVSKMLLLLWLTNMTSGSRKLQQRIWKNRFSFEPVGNFVYKVSEREFEKLAAGLNLPAVAFKKINPNFYTVATESLKADKRIISFFWLWLKKGMLDVLMSMRLLPGQVLSAIIFTVPPDAPTRTALEKSGYRFTDIPENPYLDKV